MLSDWQALSAESKATDIVSLMSHHKAPVTDNCLTSNWVKGIETLMLIYKIFRADEWAVLRDTGQTLGAPIDVSDRFVHFSTGKQVAQTCEKYFAGEEGLILLVLDSDELGDALKWETSRGGDLFPHLYRELRMQDVFWHTDLPLGPDGHIFPEGVL